ncbi:MAG: hypothetical protein EAZ42_05270 [Verrucomicrobia bacterium]|nr:MAG: hypothetical protein EAZ42_05270 [Verrucomicrobiota bacterium]
MSRKSFRLGRWFAALLAFSCMVALLYQLVYDNRPKGDVRTVENYTPWEPETLKIAETIPIQSGGRVKPLSTEAGFQMLELHGARAMKLIGKDGREIKIGPLEWMLDALFRPHLAVHQPTFRVDNSDALNAIGVKSRSKRDRYSYADLEKGREKLVELAQTYEPIETKKRDPVQSQIVDLAYKMRAYESLLGYFGFARFPIVLHGSGVGNEPDKTTDFSAVMATAPILREQIKKSQHAGSPLVPRLQKLLEQMLDGANFAKFGLFSIPPFEPKERIWQSAGNVIMNVMTAETGHTDQAIKIIHQLEKTARSQDISEAAFRKELAALRDDLKQRAEARGEYRFVPIEAAYYEINWFLYALVFFLLGTISAFAMWTCGRTRLGNVMAYATGGLTLLGVGYCIVAIVKRCIIMQRPPVGNLYDTIIFIATTAILFAFIVEWLTRQRFALGIAPVIGAFLIVLARRYELGDAKDHMDPLVAVLDSNYWLTTHVITITLGYSAGLLSAFLAASYILIRGLRLIDNEQAIRRGLTRAVYGTICLTLFLSLVGTVLGGIWANDSWGRFWGWDPKENGALMIVIWTLAILHARLGGIIKEWGIHLAAVFTAVIVVFSWWHVNFLGVGLHNYGFTAGKDAIWWFYGIIGLFLVYGFIAWGMDVSRKSKPRVQSSHEADEAIRIPS